MTREQWAKLSDQEKIYNIAELCGGKWFKLIPHTANQRSMIIPQKAPDGHIFIENFGLHEADGTENIVQIHYIPQYLSDLNVIQDAVISQDNLGFWNRYISYLSIIILKLDQAKDWKDSSDHWGTTSQFKLVNATAAQRAEAFVLAMDPI